MRHQYVRGEEREAVYETPYGDLHMAVNTHELTVDFHDGVGHVHLGYDISVEGEWQFYNQLDIDVREDIEHGHEGNPEIGGLNRHYKIRLTAVICRLGNIQKSFSKCHLKRNSVIFLQTSLCNPLV